MHRQLYTVIFIVTLSSLFVFAAENIIESDITLAHPIMGLQLTEEYQKTFGDYEFIEKARMARRNELKDKEQCAAAWNLKFANRREISFLRFRQLTDEGYYRQAFEEMKESVFCPWTEAMKTNSLLRLINHLDEVHNIVKDFAVVFMNRSLASLYLLRDGYKFAQIYRDLWSGINGKHSNAIRLQGQQWIDEVTDKVYQHLNISAKKVVALRFVDIDLATREQADVQAFLEAFSADLPLKAILSARFEENLAKEQQQHFQPVTPELFREMAVAF